jgi:hypothetical protein
VNLEVQGLWTFESVNGDSPRQGRVILLCERAVPVFIVLVAREMLDIQKPI